MAHCAHVRVFALPRPLGNRSLLHRQGKFWHMTPHRKFSLESTPYGNGKCDAHVAFEYTYVSVSAPEYLYLSVCIFGCSQGVECNAVAISYHGDPVVDFIISVLWQRQHFLSKTRWIGEVEVQLVDSPVAGSLAFILQISCSSEKFQLSSGDVFSSVTQPISPS